MLGNNQCLILEKQFIINTNIIRGIKINRKKNLIIPAKINAIKIKIIKSKAFELEKQPPLRLKPFVIFNKNAKHIVANKKYTNVPISNLTYFIFIHYMQKVRSCQLYFLFFPFSTKKLIT